MAVTAFTTTEPFDLAVLTTRFSKSETHETGTIVMHHGKVKRPGKQIKDFRDVLLEPVVPEPEKIFNSIGKKAIEDHGLLQVLIAHRVGEVLAGDDVLFVAVSAQTRIKAFAGCASIVDSVKEENAVRLVERQ